MPELKPCPFCGGEGQKSLVVGKFVFCLDCAASGPGGLTEQEAIELWNRREG